MVSSNATEADFEPLRLNYLYAGVDVTTFSVQAKPSEDGICNPLLTLSYSGTDNGPSPIPLQVEEVIPAAGEVELPEPSVFIIATERDVAKRMENQLACPYLDILDEFRTHVSFQSTESKALRRILRKGRIAVQIVYEREIFSVKLKDGASLRQYLDPAFKSFVASGDEDGFWPSGYGSDVDPRVASRYTQFVKSFGTHYFESGTFGGTFTVTVQIDKSYQGELDQIVEKLVQVVQNYYDSYNDAGAGGGGRSESLGDVIVNEIPEVEGELSISVVGADTKLVSSESVGNMLQAWFNTVPQYAMLIRATVQPIDKLILDVRKAASVRKAVRVYTLKKFLVHLKSLDKKGQFKDEIKGLLKDVDPSQRDVMQLQHKINNYLFIYNSSVKSYRNSLPRHFKIDRSLFLHKEIQ